MAIPSITYPTTLDTDDTLYSVKDSLYLTLSSDYNPGDTLIYVEANADKMDLFPDTGIITLVEQCSEPEFRAVSLHYTTKDNQNFTFGGLTVLPETPNTYKKAGASTVVMNVVAQHHNSIKDAIIAIENYVGKSSDTTTRPFTGNLVQRTEFLLGVVFTPRAWFSVDKTIGLSPLTVTFTNLSFQLGEDLPDNTISYYWDFGDGSGSIVPNFSYYTTEKVVTHTYYNPGIYTVRMKVVNKYGEDIVYFENLINAKYEAPDEAVLNVSTGATQIYFPASGYTKVLAGSPVVIYTLADQINPSTGKTYAGETVNASNQPIDPILTFTWDLSDDLTHGNDPTTTAVYTIGGLYNIVLRCDTRSEAYRITTVYDRINVIESYNAWLFNLTSGSIARANEMGFNSEVFKTTQIPYTTISRNIDFISGSLNAVQLVREFYRNTNLNAKSTASSGQGLGSTAIIHYASGRDETDPSTFETINAIEFNGFTETYSSYDGYDRPWNWIPFNGVGFTYFLLGNALNQPPGSSPTNMDLVYADLPSETYTIANTFSSANFIGSSSYLMYNAGDYDTNGDPVYGNFSAYRTTWRDRSGYILKNYVVGDAFQIKAFFGTEEDGVSLIANFNQLPDLVGPAKTEGILLNLNTSMFFFNNTGSISSFDPLENVWRTGGPGYNSIVFNNLQDTTVQDYDNEANTLVGTTDGASTAYLSFDYSNNAFIKYSDVDLTFTRLNARPTGEQWLFGTY